MSKMRINFLEEMSIRSKPPMTFEAFTKHIDNFYGLKEIGFSTDVLEYSYTDTSNKIQKFSNEEEYSQLMDVFNKGELDEVFVNLKGANTKKENKSHGGYLEFMQKVLDEERDKLETKLKLLLTDENIVKEIPNYLSVSKTHCFLCKAKYLIGPIYKCVICDDMNLCEKCSLLHEHPMLKVLG